MAAQSDLVCMVGHTRRFNPSHQWVHQRIVAGNLTIQQMNVQTYFYRRSNINALGQPRSWVDNLLWHHAAHTVDLFSYQCGEPITKANVLAGPVHPELGIPMDMSIQLRSASGQLCTLSLSFNNDGPLGTFFRYICDHGTYVARYDELVTGNDEPVDVTGVAVSMDGIELQDREFVRAMVEHDEPNASIRSVIDCYRVLGELQEQLDQATARAQLTSHEERASDLSGCGEVIDHDIADHVAIGRPSFGFDQVPTETRGERVAIVDAKEAERTDQHVHVQSVDLADEDAFVTPALEDVLEHLE